MSGRCAGFAAGPDPGREPGPDKDGFGPTQKVPDLDRALENHQRGVTVLFDLEPVLGSADGEHGGGGGDQPFAVVTLGELAEDCPDTAALDIDQDTRSAVGQVEAGLGSDVEAGRSVGNMKVRRRAGAGAKGVARLCVIARLELEFVAVGDEQEVAFDGHHLVIEQVFSYLARRGSERRHSDHERSR